MIDVPELIGIDYTGGNPLRDMAGLAGLAGPFDIVEGTARVAGNLATEIARRPEVIVRAIKYTLPGKATTPQEKLMNETKVIGWLGFGAALYFLPGWWKLLALPAGFIAAGMDVYGKQDDYQKIREAERAQWVYSPSNGPYVTGAVAVSDTRPLPLPL